MTVDEKLNMLRSLLEVDMAENDRLTVYLNAAGREILNWRYSYASEIPEAVPPEYEMTQIYAVIAGYSQSGAENQTKHTENGISRDFKYADMIAYIHANVIPFAKAL